MALHHHRIQHLQPEDHDFPQRLLSGPAPPKQLWLQGSLSASQRFIAIIGARDADQRAAEAAKALGKALVQSQFGVVSGLARGCDRLGHQAALDNGVPTVAFLGNGLGSIHPASNMTLAEDILQAGGALMSEQEPGARAWPQNLVARNRLIVGLADAVVILQAKDHGGTIHAVRQCIEAGRPIWCVQRRHNPTGSDLLMQLTARQACQQMQLLHPLLNKLDDLGIAPDQPIARALPANMMRWLQHIAVPEPPQSLTSTPPNDPQLF